MSLRPTDRAELRRSGFKASVVEGEAGWLRREHISVEIRKASRDSAIRKRRRADVGASGAEAEAVPHAPLAVDRNRMLAALPLSVQGLRLNDSRTQLKAAREFCKLLSIV